MNKKIKFSFGVIAILSILLFLTPFADPNPDGLEKAVEDHTSRGSVFNLGFLTDYGAEGSLIFQIIKDESLSVIISGLIGVLLVIGIFLIPIIISHHKKADTIH